MKNFNWKSLAFYGSAIGAVIVLFRTVTAFGEANIKASPPLTGRYRFNAQNLPECLSKQALELNLQQSGIYLFATLLPADGNKALTIETEEKPFLDGKLRDRQFILTGTLPNNLGCSPAAVKIAAELPPTSEPKLTTIAGTIALDSQPAIPFNAQLEATKSPQKTAH